MDKKKKTGKSGKTEKVSSSDSSSSTDEEERLETMQLKWLKDLVAIVTDIHTTYKSKYEKDSNSGRENKDLIKEQIERYAKSLKSSNYKFEFHKTYYLAIFKEHKEE